MSRQRVSGPSVSPGRKYGLAFLAVALAVAVHTALHAFLPRQLPFMPFALAVLVSCRWAGGSGGMAATALSAFVLRNWFLVPTNAFLGEANLGICLFLAAGLFVSWQKLAQERATKPVVVEVPRSEGELPKFEYVGGA